MKKNLKKLTMSLCGTLLIAGCSCNKESINNSVDANIKNGNEAVLNGLKDNVSNVTLKEIYDDLKSQSGNSQTADKLLEIIAEKELSTPEWQQRYKDKMAEKLLKVAKDSKYQLNGVFNEELFVKSLESELYSITCENAYGPTYKDVELDGEVIEDAVIDKYLLCDYSDYEEKALKIEVITELLNEKYIYDKVLVDKTNLLSSKKVRLVEYLSISSSEDKAFEFITEAVKQLNEEESTVTLVDIKNQWIEKLEKNIKSNYDKINTKDDSSGSTLQDFTNGYKYSKDEGLKRKIETVENGSYYDKVIVTSDNKDILNTTLMERILSDNILDENAEKTVEVNGSYYLVSPLAGSNVDVNDIRITDTTNSKYYLIKVDVVDSITDTGSYEAVKVLATNTTLVSDSINYYLEKNKADISVHDDEIYAYLKTQYKNIFVD